MSQDVMKPELIGIRETITTEHETTPPNSRLQVNTRSAHPCGHRSRHLTHTWPVPELTPVRHQPVTPGSGLSSPINPNLVQSNCRGRHHAPTPS